MGKPSGCPTGPDRVVLGVIAGVGEGVADGVASAVRVAGTEEGAGVLDED